MKVKKAQTQPARGRALHSRSLPGASAFLAGSRLVWSRSARHTRTLVTLLRSGV